MATKATLTRTEGYALQDNHKGARLDGDTLITRTAIYHWDHTAECWERTQNNLRIEHAKSAVLGHGFRWEKIGKVFLRCTCNHCHS